MIVAYTLLTFILLMLGGRFLGKHLAIGLCIANNIVSLVVVAINAADILCGGNVMKYTLWQWIDIGGIQISFQLLLDPLSITFALLISFITLLIQVYSYDYMLHDPNQVKFFAYLNLFSIAMTIMVLGGNYLVIFLGWEGVGLASYLLINFWSTRIEANQAALKAIVFNRIGDIFFMAALGLMLVAFKTLDLRVIGLLVGGVTSNTITLGIFEVPLVELLAFFLFAAAAAKSAQILLHAWLPDAMEGPTPVSALLHSATMVTAGIFLMLRSAEVLVNAPIVSVIITGFGFFTSVLSSCVGIGQYDIKKIIAYSTCSQLGFIMLGVGGGNYIFALFHLVNHAFFKALLFLCAGSVIHATGEQDIRKMGRLVESLPITYVAMLIASLSLSGFPFLSGFFSKDLLLITVYAEFERFLYAVYILTALSTFLSSFYSFRLIYYVFLGSTNRTRKEDCMGLYVTEGSVFMYGPLILLTVASVFSGYVLSGLMVNFSAAYPFAERLAAEGFQNLEFGADYVKSIPTVFSLFGILFVYLVYVSRLRYLLYIFYKKFISILNIFSDKFFYDGIVSKLVSILAPRLFGNFIIFFDKGVLEYFGPYGLGRGLDRVINYRK